MKANSPYNPCSIPSSPDYLCFPYNDPSSPHYLYYAHSNPSSPDSEYEPFYYKISFCVLKKVLSASPAP